MCALRYNALERLGSAPPQDGILNSQRIKRQYVWAKTGGRCWYCGARLYHREEADTEVKRRLVFTADHLHPRSHGGRGRANKVPACKYCNSHKSSRSVEQFRLWVHALLFDNVRRASASTPAGEQEPRRLLRYDSCCARGSRPQRLRQTISAKTLPDVRPALWFGVQ